MSEETPQEIMAKYEDKMTRIVQSHLAKKESNPVVDSTETDTDVLPTNDELTLKQFGKHFDVVDENGYLSPKDKEKLSYIIDGSKGSTGLLHQIEEKLGKFAPTIDEVYRYMRLSRQFKIVKKELNEIKDGDSKWQQ